jgi:hypothetical protein
MTPAVSTFFVSTEFNEFLYAPIGTEENKTPISERNWHHAQLTTSPSVTGAQVSAATSAFVIRGSRRLP